MASVLKRTLLKKGKVGKFAQTGRLITAKAKERRNSKDEQATTEEVTLRAFRRTYDRLHPRKAR